MQRVEIRLNDEEQDYLERMSSTGACQGCALQRAQVLLALDKGVLDGQISEVPNLECTRIWRTRKRYLKGGLAEMNLKKPKCQDRANFELLIA